MKTIKLRKQIKITNIQYMFPHITKQWHPTKNGDLNPSDFTPGSNKKIWWKCSKGEDHEWHATIYQRVRRGTGCPFCAGKKVGKDNSLSFLFPKIAKQWHPTKNGDLKPSDFTPGSRTKVWWKCTRGEDHEWKAVISSRALNYRGCPFCSGRLVSDKYNLLFLFPKVAKQWHPTKNGNLKPSDFVPGTQKIVWWKCTRGEDHEWKANINNRVANQSGCPFCSNQTSEPEIRILTELMSLFDEVQSREKIKGKEIDIFIPQVNVGIEYDSYYYHKNKKNLDIQKNNIIKSTKTIFFRVREQPLPALSKNDIILKKGKLVKSDLDLIITRLKTLIPYKYKIDLNSYIDSKSFFNEQVFRKYISYLPSPFPAKSLLRLNPTLSKEWDFKKNFPLTPRNFTPGSHKKVWWKCSKGEDHEWISTIYHRALNHRGCPFCAGKKVGKDNSLSFLFPKIAKQWHPTKNGDLKPSDFTPGSGKKVWWKCFNDHEWSSTIKNRTANQSGCVKCRSKSLN
jgi:hypothetical protein